jgi:hypothetical protein
MRHRDSVGAGAGKQVEVGTVGSCGTLAGQPRRAKQELSCGEVFDDVHGSPQTGQFQSDAEPLWVEVCAASICRGGPVL